MRYLVVFAFAILFINSSPAFAQAANLVGTCSGTINGYGYFYAYTYQYALIMNGQFHSENHSFSFNGFLEEMKNAKQVDADEKHIFYSGQMYDLAVPYIAGSGLYVKRRKTVAGPGKEKSNWVKLCSY